MDSHYQENPRTVSTPEMSNSPQQEEEHLFPEIPYALPHEDLNQFRRITRYYSCQIRALPLASLLPHRKQVSRLVVNIPDQVFVHIVEDPIDFSLTEIKHPLNLIPKTLVDNCFEPEDFSDEKGFNLECSRHGR
jgi:hypothetical protein